MTIASAKLLGFYEEKTVTGMHFLKMNFQMQCSMVDAVRRFYAFNKTIVMSHEINDKSYKINT